MNDIPTLHPFKTSHLVLTLMVQGENAHILFITHSPPGKTTVTITQCNWKYSIWWKCPVEVHTCTPHCVCMVLVYSKAFMTWYLLAPPAPSSASISGSSTVGYTQTFRLTCSVSGIANSYQWYHNYTRLPSTSSYYSKSAQQNDTGNYECRACNWAGCSSFSSNHAVTVTAGVFIVV